MLVLVSDGDDTASKTTYARALEEALRNEVMIYSIIDVPIEASAGRDLGGEHALITLAEQTGGKSFYVSEGGLDKAFTKVSEDLRTQYLLGYYPHHQEPGRVFDRLRYRSQGGQPGFQYPPQDGLLHGLAEKRQLKWRALIFFRRFNAR